MELITIEAYSFDELSDDVKEKVLDKYRDIETAYNDWHEFLIDDFTQTLAEKGFKNAKIQFSGFCSQGDGLSFTADCDLSTLFNHIDIPKPHHKKTWIELFHCTLERISHHYVHENTVKLTLGYDNYIHYRSRRTPKLNAILETIEDNLDQLRRDLCHTFYRQLENEYDYLRSDEVVSEYIRANEFKFTKEGKRI